ncbi:glycosyltransferase family 4 protein [Enterococcus lactis]|uniref:glycosyltransferase family 4 protein n=1 Tax=Enterococcus lactis TaxID=357441 RepID=UPI0029470E81|nr:glycosyltransferase family 4 protein [Enterococcus lactis]MDV5136739.1 glycosyltransferase family 4 protein [Enterococcus lactis]
MKKYLFIIPSLSKGGAERVVSVLASELIKQGRECVVVTHFRAEKEYPIEDKVKVVCLSGLDEIEYRKRINKKYLLQLAYQLRKVIFREKPDYIIPFLWTTCIRTDIALMGSSYKKAVIQTVRNNPYIYPESKFEKKYRDMLVRKSRKTIVQNNDQKQYFSTNIQNKIFVLPNPISERLLQVKRSQDSVLFRIVGVGRLEEQKNFEMLIDSVAEVYRSYPEVRLDIYGEGSLFEKLQKHINKFGLNEIITLKGRSNDYDEIYGKASAFVLSSDFEGMPNTLMEAMAVGIPCISTDCPTGPKDIIQSYKNGILVPVGNVGELSRSIVTVIQDEKLRKKFGHEAKETILSKYLPNHIGKLLIKICE